MNKDNVLDMMLEGSDRAADKTDIDLGAVGTQMKLTKDELLVMIYGTGVICDDAKGDHRET